MKLKRALEVAATNYAAWAESADKEALKSAAEASWHKGRAGVFRQASIDFRMLAGLADEAGS